MKKKYLLGAGIVIVIGLAVGGVLYANRTDTAKPTVSTKKTDTMKKDTKQTPKADTSGNPVGMQASIHHYDQAGLLNASYRRTLTDFTPWQESGVAVEYRDFNGDGTDDAFVWAKIPGTMGYSFAAVWTIGSNNQPKELWYLPSNLYVPQSDWSLTSTNELRNTGKNEDNTTLVHNFHWQVSTTGSGFVLEPDM